MRQRIYLVLAAFGLTIATACAGPTLHIRHEDPGVGDIEIRVDGEEVGVIELGEELQVALDRGVHRVEAATRDGDDLWSDGGAGWVFYLDEETLLTLLQAQPDQ